MCCEVVRAETRTQRIHHARHDERERLDRRDFIIEIDGLDEPQPFRVWNQRPRSGAARELVKPDAFLSETLGNFNSRKLCQRAERTDSPAVQRFQNFR